YLLRRRQRSGLHRPVLRAGDRPALIAQPSSSSGACMHRNPLAVSAVALLLLSACGGSKKGDDAGHQPGGGGDGVVDPGEGCDDGNKDATDACTSQCKPASCGDGFVQAGTEGCDDGTANSDAVPGACRTTCQKASCGDGVTDPGEECDDGNQVNDGGCNTACALPASGDGIFRAGNQCAKGPATSDMRAAD